MFPSTEEGEDTSEFTSYNFWRATPPPLVGGAESPPIDLLKSERTHPQGNLAGIEPGGDLLLCLRSRVALAQRRALVLSLYGFDVAVAGNLATPLLSSLSSNVLSSSPVQSSLASPLLTGLPRPPLLTSPLTSPAAERAHGGATSGRTGGNEGAGLDGGGPCCSGDEALALLDTHPTNLVL